MPKTDPFQQAAYTKLVVHEVRTDHGLVVVTDRPTHVDIKVLDEDAGDEIQYIDPSEAEELTRQEFNDAWARGRTAGQCESADDVADLLRDALDDWHDNNHQGVARCCATEPCASLYRALRLFDERSRD